MGKAKWAEGLTNEPETATEIFESKPDAEILTEIKKPKRGRPMKRAKQGMNQDSPQTGTETSATMESSEPLEAYFCSRKVELLIWIVPPTEILLPNGGRQVIDKGLSAAFYQNRYHTSDKKIIDYICNMEEFKHGLEIFPDPSDPSGYWEKEGYFEKVTQEMRIPTDKVKNLIGEATQQMKRMVRTVAVKTSAVGGN